MTSKTIKPSEINSMYYWSISNHRSQFDVESQVYYFIANMGV